jgi:hypothetical protein
MVLKNGMSIRFASDETRYVMRDVESAGAPMPRGGGGPVAACGIFVCRLHPSSRAGRNVCFGVL